MKWIFILCQSCAKNCASPSVEGGFQSFPLNYGYIGTVRLTGKFNGPILPLGGHYWPTMTLSVLRGSNTLLFEQKRVLIEFPYISGPENWSFFMKNTIFRLIFDHFSTAMALKATRCTSCVTSDSYQDKSTEFNPSYSSYVNQNDKNVQKMAVLGVKRVKTVKIDTDCQSNTYLPG